MELPFTGGRETSRSLSHKSAGQLSGSQLKSSDSRAGGRGGCGGSIDRIVVAYTVCVCTCVSARVCVTEGMLVRIRED